MRAAWLELFAQMSLAASHSRSLDINTQLLQAAQATLQRLPSVYSDKFPGMRFRWSNRIKPRRQWPLVVSIFGPSGAGKTTTAKEFQETMDKTYPHITTTYIDGDGMYKIRYNVSDWSTPAAIDSARLKHILDMLIQNHTVKNVTFFNPWLPNGPKPEQKAIQPADVIIVDSFMGDLDDVLNSYYDLALLVDASKFQRWLRRVGGMESGAAMMAEAAYMKKYEELTNSMIIARAKTIANAILMRNGGPDYELSEEKHLTAKVLAQALSMSLSNTTYPREQAFVNRALAPLFDTDWAHVFHAPFPDGTIAWQLLEHLAVANDDIRKRVDDIAAFTHCLKHVVGVCGSPEVSPRVIFA